MSPSRSPRRLPGAADPDRPAPDETPSLFDRIRQACAEVSRRAGSVRIDASGLDVLTDALAAAPWPAEDLDPAHHFRGDASSRLAFVICLDAINFGSGWFPKLLKRDGVSGYRTIAGACKAHFEANGPLDGKALRASTPSSMAALLGQDLGDPDRAELLGLYARAWRELGAWLLDRHGDRFASVVEGVGHSAARLVASLAEMPLYRDVASYDDLVVPFYKRAQITVADLHRAFGDDGVGRFDDLDSLTLFADNLVPHVLRCRGVLSLAPALAEQIDAGRLLESGSREEVELRACAVEAVERLVVALGSRGRRATARELDGLLWNAGQAPEIKARPRPRVRCPFY